jgi:VCBS repeat-containing protein
MFAGSPIGSGDECKAAAAAPSQIIGNIQTAIGYGALRRANGIAVQVTVGDPVCQGDEIETAADGRIGIRFVDGTVFSLSPGTRVVLNEFFQDASGIPRSAMFRVTRGTFAFIAGQVAESGGLTVDTPVASIRGRTRAGGFGMLSLVALTFAAMEQARAADSDVTLLDDDSITYKQLEHGTFELVTKEAIPRHLIIEDPGETVVLSSRGSSVSVNQVTNSLARMEELQAAQQDVLANLAKGLGPNGSSTPPFTEPLPVQPINFIQTDTPSPQNSLPPLPVHVAPDIVVIQPKTFPTPPTLTVASGPTEIDTSVFDQFTATSGTFSASSAGGAPLTFGIVGGTSGATVVGGTPFDVSQTSSFGTLFLNSATGAYTFVPNSAAINALTAPTTDSFTITVSDGTLSADETFTIPIDGVNDAAIISGTTTGSATAAATPSAQAAPGIQAALGTQAAPGAPAPSGTPTATGTLTDTDVDNPPNTFTAVNTPTASAGGYGTYTITASGVWTYTVNSADPKVQALNVGDTLTDTFTVTTIDGTPQVVTITIHGVNDAAIVSGATTGAAIEAGHDAAGTPTVTGTLTDTDVDNPANAFMAVTLPTASTGGYGTFTMTAAGVWTYTLNNANPKVQALNVGDTLTDTFTVTTIDGTPQVVTITIDGTNDAAVISGKTIGCVIEPGCHTHGKPTATGTLTDTDVDNPANTFEAVISPTASTGGYGTFTMTAAGVWSYTLDETNPKVQALGDHCTLTDTFTVTTIDGTAQVVTITIVGSDDDHHHHDRGDFRSSAVAVHETTSAPVANAAFEATTIAAAADNGQTIQGTGRNDAIKVRAGSDTTSRGSGSEAGNGSDAIAGRYETDDRTGHDGHGHGGLAYLSVTDPGATWFTPDFISESDRIKLAAFGATAVISLTSANTSVPAHTIACFHDSATDQTIAYVNPTDQTLSIGDACLLEINLHGTSAAGLSDGAEPAAAGEVLSGWTVSDGALLADATWTLRTTDGGHGSVSDRDPFDWADHGGPASSDEVLPCSGECAGAGTMIAPTNGLSGEPQAGHAAANKPAFHQMPAPDGAGAATGQSGTPDNAGMPAPTADPVHAADTHIHAIDPGPNFVFNTGIPNVFENGWSTAAGSNANSHGPWSNGDNDSNSDGPGGHGNAAAHGAGAFDSEPSSSAHAASGGGAGGPGDSFHFKHDTGGFADSNAIQPSDDGHGPASIGYLEIAAGTREPSAISDGAKTVEPSVSGQHASDHLNVLPDHAGDAVVTHGHDLIV